MLIHENCIIADMMLIALLIVVLIVGLLAVLQTGGSSSTPQPASLSLDPATAQSIVVPRTAQGAKELQQQLQKDFEAAAAAQTQRLQDLEQAATGTAPP